MQYTVFPVSKFINGRMMSYS